MQIRRCQGVYPLPNIPLSSAADQLYVVKAVVKAWRSYQPKSGCGKFQSTGYGFVKALQAGFEFHWSWSASRLVSRTTASKVKLFRTERCLAICRTLPGLHGGPQQQLTGFPSVQQDGIRQLGF